MPLTSEPASGSLRFGPSVAGELLFLAKATAAGDPLAAEVPPGLARKVAEFWGDDVFFWELFVLAEAAESLLGPLPSAELAERLGAGLARMETEPALGSEPEGDRQVVRGRLARLAGDRRLAARYLKLLADLWAVFEEEWERRLPGLERVSEECRRREEVGSGWRSLLKVPETSAEIQEAGWERAVSSGATVGICAFGGSLVIDLPGTQFFAYTARDGGGFDRERAEELARRARALADPTRLSLLHLLALEERGVGDLAGALGVSQPTVSNHVKLLREAGLVTSSAGRRGLQIRREELERLLAEIERYVAGD